MRTLGALLVVATAFVQTPRAQAPQSGGPSPAATVPTTESRPPAPAPVGTMSELMVKVIYPYSDALFYIQRSPPKTEVEWGELQGKALALAELGNVLMMPGRARDQDQWLRDAKLMAEGGAAAFKAAKAKDVEAIVALNDQIVASCTTCHMHYRPAYGRRRLPPPPAQQPVPPAQ
jgi:hypothetical protein